MRTKTIRNASGVLVGVKGDSAKFDEFRSTLDSFEFWWPIITPKETM